jgi:hypothetical protein
MNFKEKEDKLITKGYIRENISSCVVPILLIQKKGWDLENMY